MRSAILLFLVATALLVSMAGCSERAEEIETAPEPTVQPTGTSPETYTEEQMETLRATWNEKMAAFDRHFDDIKAKVDALGDDMKAEYREQLAALEAKREELGDMLDDLKDKTGEEWQELRNTFEAMLEEVAREFEELMAKLKN